MRPPTNIICGFDSPITIWRLSHYDRIIAEAKGEARSSLGTVLTFLLALARGLLPRVAVKQYSWSICFLLFYITVVRGPYICYYCRRATTHGPSLEFNEPAFCGRCIKRHSLAEGG